MSLFVAFAVSLWISFGSNVKAGEIESMVESQEIEFNWEDAEYLRNYIDYTDLHEWEMMEYQYGIEHFETGYSYSGLESLGKGEDFTTYYTDFVKYPTKSTKKWVKSANKHIYHIKSLSDRVITGWENVDDEVLEDVAKHVFWIVTKFSSFGSGTAFPGTAFFLGDGENRTFVTARHVLMPHVCYSKTTGLQEPPYYGTYDDYQCPDYMQALDIPSYTNYKFKIPLKKRYAPLSSSANSHDMQLIVDYGSYVRDNQEDEFSKFYQIESFEYSLNNDISIGTSKYRNIYETKGSLKIDECKKGDKILIIGHPRSITAKWIYTKNGRISGKKINEAYYKGLLTITRGEIIRDCDRNFRFRYNAIVGRGMSGGMIVLESDPYALCGVVSSDQRYWSTEEATDGWPLVRYHNGVCSTDPLFAEIKNMIK